MTDFELCSGSETGLLSGWSAGCETTVWPNGLQALHPGEPKVMPPHPATRALVCVWTACAVHEYTQGVGRRSSDAGPEHEASAYGVLIAPPRPRPG